MDEVRSVGPEFFDIRYAAGKMPWDFGGVPQSLKVFLDRHRGPGRVLIPGCGSGYEIEAFSTRGWDAIGIDFSRLAVARARSLLGPPRPEIQRRKYRPRRLDLSPAIHQKQATPFLPAEKDVLLNRLHQGGACFFITAIL